MSGRFVCLKERNMLLTQMNWLTRREHQQDLVWPEDKEELRVRYTAVKKTMNRIKQVLR